jgi:hypothetical protein
MFRRDKYFFLGGNEKHLSITIWRLEWTFFDWTLSWRTKEQAFESWKALFSLRCTMCRAWTLGCGEHRFCGLCEPCKVSVEGDIND